MKVEEFKRLLSNYKGYQEDIEIVKNDIDNIWYELSGIKAIRYDKQPTTFNPHMNELYKLDLLDKLEEKQLELKVATLSVELIEFKLSKLTKEDKDMCIRVLCEQETNEKVGKDLGYTGVAIWKKIRANLSKIL